MTAALADLAPSVATYPACRGCGRPIRPWHSRAVDHPGTVAHGRRDHCATCARGNPTDAVRELIEDVEWLTRPGNFVDTPQRIATRLGYTRLTNLYAALYRANAHELLRRLQAKAAEG